MWPFADPVSSWQPFIELYGSLAEDEPVVLSAAQQRLVRRVARSVVIPRSEIGRLMADRAGQRQLMTMTRQRIRDGSRRLSQAIIEAGRRADAGDLAGARQVMKAAAKAAVVPFYRRTARSHLKNRERHRWKPVGPPPPPLPPGDASS